MPKPHRYLDGLMAAQVAVAEITGKVKVGDLNDRAWIMICEIHKELANLSAAEASALTNKEHPTPKTG